MDQALVLQKKPLHSKALFEQKEAFSKITYEYSNSLGFNKKIVN